METVINMLYNYNAKLIIKETENKFISHINSLNELRKEIKFHPKSYCITVEIIVHSITLLILDWLIRYFISYIPKYH